MFGENRGIALTILLVIVISVASLIGVIYSLVEAFESIEFGEVRAINPDRVVSILPQRYDYNFSIPEDISVSEQLGTSEVSDPASKNSLADDIQDQATGAVYNYNFAIPHPRMYPAIRSIQIPSINYDSPVIVSDDANAGIDLGAWYYPSKHPFEGEAIFLCHRRFFKENDPKSCWNLDKVDSGDFVYLNFSNGEQFTYQVRSIAVTTGKDISIYHSGDEPYLKLISCAKENGRIGSDSHRIVLIAKKV